MASLTNNNACLQPLRHAILQEAVRGELTKQNQTKQNRTDEPAVAIAILKRLKGEKEKRIRAGQFKKDKELSFNNRR